MRNISRCHVKCRGQHTVREYVRHPFLGSGNQLRHSQALRINGAHQKSPKNLCFRNSICFINDGGTTSALADCRISDPKGRQKLGKPIKDLGGMDLDRNLSNIFPRASIFGSSM